jgi:hypothetical protein
MATAPINTTTQAGLSPYISEYAGNLLGRGQALAETPYTPYGGNRVAGFSPLQQQAFEGIGSLAGYTPQQYSGPSQYLQSALQETGNIGGYSGARFSGPDQNLQAALGEIGGTQAYGPQQYTGQSFNDPGRMQQFMSPYQQGVTDIAMREARRSSDIAGQGENALAAQRGAFGGARHAIMGAERARNLQQSLGDIQTKGLQSAYDAAQRQFNTESAQEQQRQQLQDLSNRFGYTSGVEAAGRRLSAAERQQQATGERERAQEAVDRFGYASGVDAAGKRLAAGERQQQTEQQRQYLQDLSNRYGYTSGIDALARQLTAGGQQQALEQKGLDIDYENFGRQFKYPYEQLQFQKSLLQGLPITTSSVTGQVPKTDWLSTLGGVGGLLANNPNVLNTATGGIKDLVNWLRGISGGGGGGGGGGSFPEGVYGGGYTMPESSEIDEYLKNISEAE